MGCFQFIGISNVLVSVSLTQELIRKVDKFLKVWSISPVCFPKNFLFKFYQFLLLQHYIWKYRSRFFSSLTWKSSNIQNSYSLLLVNKCQMFLRTRLKHVLLMISRQNKSFQLFAKPSGKKKSLLLPCSYNALCIPLWKHLFDLTFILRCFPN